MGKKDKSIDNYAMNEIRVQHSISNSINKYEQLS